MSARVEIIASTILVGTLTAMAMPKLHVARQRSYQKRVIADMLDVSAAWEAWANEHRTYSVTTDRSVVRAEARNFANSRPVRFEDLERALVPKYIAALPRRDPWGNDFDFRIGRGSVGLEESYAIRSTAQDGEAEADFYVNRVTYRFRDDIVLWDGLLFQYPDGI